MLEKIDINEKAVKGKQMTGKEKRGPWRKIGGG